MASVLSGPQAFAAPLKDVPVPEPETTAAAKAKQTGQPVEVTERTSETTKIMATPQGTMILDRSVAPVRVKREGAWRDTDLTLERRADGSVAPRVSAADVSFGGGGDGRLATMVKDGKSLTLSLPAVTLPQPVLNGEGATFSEIKPGLDLVVKATAMGLGHYLVVKTPEAAADPGLAKVKFGVQSSGVQLKERSTGGLAAVDAEGKAVFSAPAPMMWEGVTPAAQATRASVHPDQVSAGPALGADVVKMDVQAEADALTLVPDQSLLKSVNTKFPVVIDPGWQVWDGVREGDDGGTDEGWAYVDEAFPNQEYIKPDRLPTGWEAQDNTNKRSYIRMNVDTIWRYAGGRHVEINNVALTFDTQWAWSCAGRDVRLFNTEHISGSTTWHTRPDGYIPPGSGWSSSWLATSEVQNKGRPECGDDGAANNVTFRGGNLNRLVQWATDHEWDLFTLGIFPDETRTDTHSWKVFDPDPRMTVEYSRVPNAPANMRIYDGKDHPCKTGEARPLIGKATTARIVKADVSDVDGDGAGGGTSQKVGADFVLTRLHQAGTTWSGSQAPISHNAQGIINAQAAIPLAEMLDEGKLSPDSPKSADGGTGYAWRVQAKDETGLKGPWSPWCELVVDTTAPNAPAVSSPQYPQGAFAGYDGATRGYKSTKFTLGPNGSGDVIRFVYAFSDGTKGDKPVTAGQSLIEDWTPKKWGWQWLTVTAYDRAGNPSPTTRYDFGVEQPPRDAAWSMDDQAGPVARAVAGSGMLRPGANATFTGATFGQPGNIPGVASDRSVKLNGTNAFGEVTAVLKPSGGPEVPLVDTSKRFMFATWVKLASTTGNQAAVSQQMTDGSVFELGWFGARWTFRHRKADGTVLAAAVRSQEQPANASAWTDHWVSLMAGYDPQNQKLWLRTQAPDADLDPVLNPATVTVAAPSTPAAGQGSLLLGAVTTGSTRTAHWNGWLDDTQVWPLSYSDDGTLNSMYGETVQMSSLAGSERQLVSAASGYCLDVPGASGEAGLNLTQWHCNGQKVQKWHFTPTGDEDFYTLTNPGNNKCLDVEADSTADNANVEQSDCDGSPAQVWQVKPVVGGHQLVSKISGKCLAVPGSSIVPGYRIIQWTCSSSDSQVWNLFSKSSDHLHGLTYKLTNVNSGHCLDVAGRSAESGANVYQWTCNGDPAQEWAFTHVGDGGYTLKNPSSGKCLTVEAPGTDDGADVRQRDCASTPTDNQIWQVVRAGAGYQLFSKGSGRALGVKDESTAPGDAGDVVQQTSGAPPQDHQVWSLHYLRVTT